MLRKEVPIKLMAMIEEETWNDRDRRRLLSKTRPPQTIGDLILDEEEEEEEIVIQLQKVLCCFARLQSYEF